MTRRCVPPILIFALLLGVGAVPFGATGQMSSFGTPDWEAVAVDQKLDARTATLFLPDPDPRSDLVRVAMADDPNWIYVQVWTRPDPAEGTGPLVPPPRIETTVAFTLQRANQTEDSWYRLVAQEGPRFALEREGHTVRSVIFQHEAGATAWNFTVRFPRTALDDIPPRAQDRLGQVHATTTSNDAFADRAPDTGEGEYAIRTDTDGTVIPSWVAAEGVDFAGGPSVAVADDGTVHIAYYVDRDERGTETGVWHTTATRDGTQWSLFPTRIDGGRFAAGDTHNTRDAQTQTRVAVDADGNPHVLYLSAPGSSDGALRYAHQETTGWTREAPGTLASGDTIPTLGGHRSIPALALGEGRIVAAFQSRDLDTVAVVERKDDGWHLVRTLDDARFPKLQIDPEGTIHVAFFRETSDQSPNRAVYGDLVYTRERNGWSEETIVQDVEDRSKFWETAATDGSFAFALGPKGEPHFVYETDREVRRFVTLADDGTWHHEHSPLTPVHGNIQNRMRMAIDGDGRAHIVTGYGGEDLYGLRAPDGGWLVEDIDGGEMFDVAVTRDGRAMRVHTQPHGGTTLALLGQSHSAGTPAPDDEAGPASGPDGDVVALPALGAPLAVLGLVATMGLLTAGARATVDRRPAVAAPAFAALGGFTRISKDKLLENRTREEIAEAVGAHPGATPAELRRMLGIPRSTFFYHLRRLEEERLLRVRREAGRLWVYPPEREPDTVRDPVQDQLLAVTRDAPGKTAADYAERLGRSRRTILHHLQELERRNQVTRFQINPRNVRWGIVPDADLEEGG